MAKAQTKTTAGKAKAAKAAPKRAAKAAPKVAAVNTGKTVGFVGLGIMGSAMSGNLLKAGFKVVGFDLLKPAVTAFVKAGGVAATSPRDVAQKADVVILSLPSTKALHAVVNGPDGLLASGKTGLIVVETGTFPIPDKEQARDDLAKGGMICLDCPLSGTGAQARAKELVIFVSGDRKAGNSLGSVFEGFTSRHVYVGAFGNGSKMKFVANHLVNIHNVAAAEAMVLGMKGGLDPEVIFDVISTSPATSRMLQVRGPMMVADDYKDATMKNEVWMKDVQVIGDFARQIGMPVPLFAVAAQPYMAAMSQGRAKEDTASVCAVYEEMARFKRKKKAAAKKAPAKRKTAAKK